MVAADKSATGGSGVTQTHAGGEEGLHAVCLGVDVATDVQDFGEGDVFVALHWHAVVEPHSAL